MNAVIVKIIPLIKKIFVFFKISPFHNYDIFYANMFELLEIVSFL